MSWRGISFYAWSEISLVKKAWMDGPISSLVFVLCLFVW